MTRLQSNDIAFLSEGLADYDLELFRKTGRTLKGIACQAAGLGEDQAEQQRATCLVGVIPMTCGMGIIEGFSETVRSVIAHLGFRALVSASADVAGLAEAIEKGCHIVLAADDDRFVAVNLREGRLVDNAEATGRGFVSGLRLMADHLWGERVLVIGCGRVGRSAVQALSEQGIEAGVYDLDKRTCRAFAEEVSGKLDNSVKMEEDLSAALDQYRLLIDATPARNLIAADAIRKDTYVSAPGVPIGLTPAAVNKLSGRLLHDPLQIGLATMVLGASSSGRNNSGPTFFGR